MFDKEQLKVFLELNKLFFDKDIKRLEERFVFMDRALELHDKVLEHRLESLNDLREEVTRDRNKFVTSKEFTLADKRLSNVENRLAIWAGVFIVIFAIIEVILRYIKW